MQKVTVYLKAFDRKRNWYMLKKKGFLGPKRNSSSLSIHHFVWTDFFLSVASRERTCLLNLGADCVS